MKVTYVNYNIRVRLSTMTKFLRNRQVKKHNNIWILYPIQFLKIFQQIRVRYSTKNLYSYVEVYVKLKSQTTRLSVVKIKTFLKLK